MSVRQKNLDSNFRLPGVFATAAAYLAYENKDSASAGDVYYDTTENQLKTNDGSSWSPAGQSGTSAGSLDDAANVGQKITIDGGLTTGIEIEATDGIISTNGALLLLDNDDTGADVHCLELTNAGTAAALQFTAGQAGTDIQGTGNTWLMTSAGAGTFTSLILGDDAALNFGGSTDAIIQWDQTRLALTAAADSVFRIGANAFSYDVEFIGDTSTANIMKWDLNGGADSVGALIFDNADLDLGDSDIIRFGDSQDVTMGYVDSGDNFQILHTGGKISFGTDGDASDIYFYSDTSGDYVFWDEDNAILDLLDVKLDLDDDAILRFGSSNDVAFEYDGTSDELRITGSGKTIILGASGAGLDLKWWGNLAGDYILFDEDNARVDFVDIDVALNDDAYLYFGTSRDANFKWDDSNGELDFTGNLNITGNLSISGAFDIGNFVFGDDEELRFGNSNDFVFQYDSNTANMAIDAAAANDTIDYGSTVNTDIIFHGGNAGYDVHFDASANTLGFLDNAELGFGNTANSPDIYISWDTTRLNIVGSGEEIRFGSDGEGIKITFFGETSGADMVWAESLDVLTIGTGASVDFADDCLCLFGAGTSSGGDWSIHSDGTSLFIREIAEANKGVEFGVDDHGVDVKFFGEASGGFMEWDQDGNTDGALVFNVADIMMGDGDKIILGDGGDLTSSASGTTVTTTLKAGSAWNISDTDNTASKITFGLAGGTYGLDIVLQSVTSGDAITWEAATNTLTFVDSAAVFDYDDGTVSYTVAAVTGDFLSISGDDTSACKLVLGTHTNTNGMDIQILSITNGAEMVFDATDKTFIIDGIDVTLEDDDILKFGDTGDVYMFWDDTTLNVHAIAADTPLAWGGTGYGFDMTYYFETAGSIHMDYDGDDMTLDDFVTLRFGSGQDVGMGYDGTTFLLSSITADKPLSIGGTTFGFDMTYYFETAGTVDFDYDADNMTFSDNMALHFGTGDDITILWDASKLVIDGAAADTVISIGASSNQDIVIYGDSTNQDVEFDTSAETVTFTDFNITMSGTTSANITTALQSDYGGLVIPVAATASPASTDNPAAGAIFYEVDASKLWIHAEANVWNYFDFDGTT